MLDYLEHPFGLACREGMIEGGRQVKQHHGASKNSHASSLRDCSRSGTGDDMRMVRSATGNLIMTKLYRDRVVSEGPRRPA